MVSLKLAFALIYACAVQVQCDDDEEQTCATLFSRDNFGGRSLTIEASRYIVNLKEEHRYSGWTNSIRVETGCKITACENTHFHGTCKSFTSSQTKINRYLASVKSADCTCKEDSSGNGVHSNENADMNDGHPSDVGGVAQGTSDGKGIDAGNVSGVAQGTSDGKGGQGTSAGVQDHHPEKDQSSLGTADKDCGCAAIITQMKQEMDQLKSAVERTEKLIDADRIKVDIWEKLKSKWIKHFEL